ncbi:MAG: hypothetical protein ACKO3W_09280 [bacterium]
MHPSEVERVSIAARMRRLYGLAFHICGCSHRAVQRSIGRDVRSMVAACDIPTLACVIDLARALEMRPAVAVELLVGLTSDAANAATADNDSGTSAPSDGVLEDPCLVTADLTDDVVSLEQQLRRIPITQSPLHNALLARIFASRGAIERARALIRGVHRDVHRDMHRDVHRGVTRVTLDPTTARFLSMAIGEVALARPDTLDTFGFNPSAWDRCPTNDRRWLRERVPPCEQPRRTLEIRARFHDAAICALRTDDHGRASASLDRLADELEQVRQSENHMATAWAASITALAALAMLGPRRQKPAPDTLARRIAVRAGFALDDVACCGDPMAERLACTRRARVVLAERTVRAACGEDPLGLVDATDLAEIAAAVLRFPDADASLHPFGRIRTFSQSRHSRLDQVALAPRMNARSRCAHGVACSHP